ncbi:MAG: hypothetical protein Q4A71_02980 [Actinomycetaceae bacterium]|nr:hypothetical protein [Actinomycetaceae bacterium]
MRNERGEATVEFVLMVLICFIPLVQLVVALAGLEAASFATESALRDASRIIMAGGKVPAAQQAARLSFADQHIRATVPEIRVSCSGNGCRPGGRAALSIRVNVLLPGFPEVIDKVVPARVPITSSTVITVPKLRS